MMNRIVSPLRSRRSDHKSEAKEYPLQESPASPSREKAEASSGLTESEAFEEDGIEKLLQLTVVGADDLPGMDLTGYSDPYVVIKFGVKKYKTRCIKRSLSPKWNETFHIPVRETEVKFPVRLEVWDWDRVSTNDYIGEVEILLERFPLNQVTNFLLPIGGERAHRLRKYKPKKKIQQGVIHVSGKLIERSVVEQSFWRGLWAPFAASDTDAVPRAQVEDMLEILSPNGFSREDIEEICKACSMTTGDVPPAGPVEGATCDDSTVDTLVKVDQMEESAKSLTVDTEINIRQPLCEAEEVEREEDSSPQLPETLSVNAITNYLCTDGRENGLTQKLLPANSFIWRVYLKTEDGSTSVGDVVLNNGKIADQLTEFRTDSDFKRKILVYDREHGKISEERIPTYITVSMKMMFQTRSGRTVSSLGMVQRFLEKMTVRQGRQYNSAASRKNIVPFIKYHELDVDEIADELESFQTFNEFFYRKLKPEARPIAAPEDDSILVSPADCRLNCFENVSIATELWIKGQGFTLNKLLNDDALASRFDGGSIAIARLAPQDYHRFHSPCAGVVGPKVDIPGCYYTVNPIAIKKSIGNSGICLPFTLLLRSYHVFGTNRRLIMSIDSPEFGLVGFVAVGATMVGSVVMTVVTGQSVAKGEEVGYFAFGGSTVILLFERQHVMFDKDIMVNSTKPLETRVKQGEHIGKTFASRKCQAASPMRSKSPEATPVRPSSPEAV